MDSTPLLGAPGDGGELQKDFEGGRTACSMLRSFFTMAQWLPKYSLRKNLGKDVIAGVTVGVMSIPQSIAYAQVAGLPPIYGLYNNLIGTCGYAFFGTSPHLITGPTAVMSLLVANSIPATFGPHNINTGVGFCSTDPSSWDTVECKTRIELALCLSFMAGLLQILMGISKAGFLISLISEPIITAFTTGSAVIIASTQVRKLLGQPHIKACAYLKGYSFLEASCGIFRGTSQMHAYTILFSSCMIIFLVLYKKSMLSGAKRRGWLKYGVSMGPLLAMVTSILLMAFTSPDQQDPAENNWGISLTGSICATTSSGVFHPECLPKHTWPFTFAPVNITLADIGSLIGPAIVVSLIGYMESMTIAKTVAKKQDVLLGTVTRVDASKELISLGFCNTLCSQFSGYPVTGSFSRTAVNASTGARSPVAVMTCSLIACLSLLILTPILKFIPSATLSSIVVVSIVQLINVSEARLLWGVSKRDFCVFVITSLLTMLWGVQQALIVGILLNWASYLAQPSPLGVQLLGFDEEGRPEAGLTDLAFGPQAQAMARGKGGKAATEGHACVVAAVVSLNEELCFHNATELIEVVDLVRRVACPYAVILDLNKHGVDGSGLRCLASVSSDLSYAHVQFFVINASLRARASMAHTRNHEANLQTGGTRWRVPSGDNDDFATEVIGIYGNINGRLGNVAREAHEEAVSSTASGQHDEEESLPALRVCPSLQFVAEVLSGQFQPGVPNVLPRVSVGFAVRQLQARKMDILPANLHSKAR